MGKRVLIKLLDATWGLSSLIPATLGVGGFLAARLHPERYTELQWLGLFLPLVLGINIVLMAYWMVRKKYWFVIPLLAVLLNIPYMPRIIQWPYKQINPAEIELAIATYNIQHGWGEGLPEISREIAGFMQDEKIDILCFQEFPGNEERQQMIIEAFGFLPYYRIHASSPGDLHIALFSRYPILRSRDIVFQDESNNTAMYADLDVDGQIIRIINNHLQTTNINQVGGNPLGSINQPTKVMRMREMMNENGVIRARQADRIRVMMDESSYPLIVCGDFNDTPASYTYRKIKGDLEDSFRAAGKGYAYTYRYLRKSLRIDYLFYSPGVFRATRYYSPDLEYSDHKPVIVSLDVTPAPVEPEE